jgi:mRNA deadenylase 3'-5' endonuclease subunit Ccr4
MLKKNEQKSMASSKSQSSSDFSIISHEQKGNDQCLFCNSGISEEHLKIHNFPPLKYNCSNYQGLIDYVK